jgi:hypothetical protein
MNAIPTTRVRPGSRTRRALRRLLRLAGCGGASTETLLARIAADGTTDAHRELGRLVNRHRRHRLVTAVALLGCGTYIAVTTTRLRGPSRLAGSAAALLLGELARRSSLAASRAEGRYGELCDRIDRERSRSAH